MNYCSACGGENFSITEESYTLDIMNLPEVTARGLTVHTCNECGEKYVDYPTANSFSEDICESLVSVKRRLSAEEIVYLRKFTVLTARAFAGILGKHPVTVSAWENRKAEIPKGAEMLLRYRVANQLRMSINDVATGADEAEVRVLNTTLYTSKNSLVSSQDWGEAKSAYEEPALPMVMMANGSWA